MESQEEAKELYNAVVRAEKAFKENDFIKDVKEGEVKFRYEAIKGMLIMARNETFAMFQEWNKDFIS